MTRGFGFQLEVDWDFAVSAGKEITLEAHHPAMGKSLLPGLGVKHYLADSHRGMVMGGDFRGELPESLCARAHALAGQMSSRRNPGEVAVAFIRLVLSALCLFRREERVADHDLGIGRQGYFFTSRPWTRAMISSARALGTSS